MKAVFFGSGLFPLRMFQTLTHQNSIKSLHLITVPSQGYKEKNQIMDYAKKMQLQILQPDLKNQTHIEQLISDIKGQCEFGLVCNYGYMIPSQIINLFSKGLYVIHPSLLPQYRGAAPIQRALINNEKQTGVSFIEISANKFDAGNILLQKQIDIDSTDRYLELSDKLSILSNDCIPYFITNFQNLPKISQENGNDGSKAPKIRLEKLTINFNDDASKWYHTYRGVYGTKFHSLKLTYEDKQLYIENLSLPSEEENNELLNFQGVNGSIFLIRQKKWKNYLYIKFKSGWWRLEAFRFTDRGLVQKAYTFRDQYLKDYQNDGSKQFL